MARLVHQPTYSALSATRPIELSRLLIVLMQLAVLGGIGVFLMLAIVNTVLGAPQAEPVYTPYQ